jgi:hypothetical protein
LSSSPKRCTVGKFPASNGLLEKTLRKLNREKRETREMGTEERMPTNTNFRDFLVVRGKKNKEF